MPMIENNLEKIIPKDNIKYNEPMSKHTSFKTGGNADLYIIGKNINEINKIVDYAKTNNIPIYIIGNGSNLLVTDKGVRGIVLKIEIDTLNIEEKEQKIMVTAGAGIKVMALAQVLKQKEITGFEELAGIPGTIGGANFMNAGAYGKEIKDIILQTKVLNKETKKVEILKKEEQQLVYRGSIFKNNKYIILETTIELSKGKKEEIEEKMNNYLRQRKEKQPLENPSAGSTFKRGEGYITAQLIDECRTKGIYYRWSSNIRKACRFYNK